MPERRLENSQPKWSCAASYEWTVALGSSCVDLAWMME